MRPSATFITAIFTWASLISGCDTVNIPISRVVLSDLTVVPDGMVQRFVDHARACGFTKVQSGHRRSASYVFFADASAELPRGTVSFSLAQDQGWGPIILIYTDSGRWRSEGYSEEAKKFIWCLAKAIEIDQPGVFKLGDSL